MWTCQLERHLPFVEVTPNPPICWITIWSAAGNTGSSLLEETMRAYDPSLHALPRQCSHNTVSWSLSRAFAGTKVHASGWQVLCEIAPRLDRGFRALTGAAWRARLRLPAALKIVSRERFTELRHHRQPAGRTDLLILSRRVSSWRAQRKHLLVLYTASFQDLSSRASVTKKKTSGEIKHNQLMGRTLKRWQEWGPESAIGRCEAISDESWPPVSQVTASSRKAAELA